MASTATVWYDDLTLPTDHIGPMAEKQRPLQQWLDDQENDQEKEQSHQKPRFDGKDIAYGDAGCFGTGGHSRRGGAILSGGQYWANVMVEITFTASPGVP